MWNALSLLGLLDKARSHLIAHKSNSKSAGINSQSEIIELQKTEYFRTSEKIKLTI